MKRIRILTSLFIISTFSLMMFYSCELFTPTYEEFELYGTWDIEKISIDVDIEGDNLLIVLAARALVASYKDELDEEMQHQLDSLGGQIIFNEDNTYHLAILEDADTGTWAYNVEDNTISLTAGETTIDQLNIEKLNSSDMILSWISKEAELESDSTNERFTAQVTIEAFFKRTEE